MLELNHLLRYMHSSEQDCLDQDSPGVRQEESKPGLQINSEIDLLGNCGDKNKLTSRAAMPLCTEGKELGPAAERTGTAENCFSKKPMPKLKPITANTETQARADPMDMPISPLVYRMETKIHAGMPYISKNATRNAKPNPRYPMAAHAEITIKPAMAHISSILGHLI